MYDLTLREEELKNKVAHDYFSKFDSTKIIGNVDFCIAVPQDEPALFEQESLLWAESKSGKRHDIYESFVQLIITIGKARTFDKVLPPAFLGAFDAEKIGFLPYHKVIDIFYQNDFNWNVTPSDHETKEFKQVLELVRSILDSETYIFKYLEDDKDLRKFIQSNFVVGKSSISKLRITRNNFITIYIKWAKEVKPTIAVNWEIAKKNGIIDADFFLADLLSEHDITLKDKLFVLLRNDRYELDRKLNEMGLFDSQTAFFNDKQRAHIQFWNKYNRPPKREYWDYIVERRDLLVPQDVRERKGSYFTPQIWVEKSQQYLADVLGENWQDEYFIWDCCAGTGNMEVGLTNKNNIWASTIDQADVDVIKDRIKNGANLFENHVFQFDFLNDEFLKLPQGLQDIINDEDKRKKLVVYINPPYKEHANRATILSKGRHQKKVATSTKAYSIFSPIIKSGARELFAQFFLRVYKEIPSAYLASFSTLKHINSSNFILFREYFQATMKKGFICESNTFDNVDGKFPISFLIWDTKIKSKINSISVDIYNSDLSNIGTKCFYSINKGQYMIDWFRPFICRSGKSIGSLRMQGNDMQQQNNISIDSVPTKNDIEQCTYTFINSSNILGVVLYFAIKHCIEATWINNRDQFLYPDDRWNVDKEFQCDCIAWALFSNNIQSKYGTNHWIPFTEDEVGVNNEFESHFMTDFIRGKCAPTANNNMELFATETELYIPTEPLQFSAEATAVFDAGKELWRYYHTMEDANPNASLYDIKAYFQGLNDKGKMNTTSNDAHYMELIKTLRAQLKILAEKIQPKVYEYGFLK